MLSSSQAGVSSHLYSNLQRDSWRYMNVIQSFETHACASRGSIQQVVGHCKLMRRPAMMIGSFRTLLEIVTPVHEVRPSTYLCPSLAQFLRTIILPGVATLGQ